MDWAIIALAVTVVLGVLSIVATIRGSARKTREQLAEHERRCAADKAETAEALRGLGEQLTGLSRTLDKFHYVMPGRYRRRLGRLP